MLLLNAQTAYNKDCIPACEGMTKHIKMTGTEFNSLPVI